MTLEPPLKAEAQRLGIDVTVGHGSKHPFVEWHDAAGRRHRMTFARRPGDWHAWPNCRSTFRRLMGTAK